ncbi:Dabb family protein [Burkholderia cenocepacia]|uniref:Dabb family protein n=1 Tax=Burkholderia cenocepacia TaxID=95486 RepID=A0AAW4TCF5_9BURK|nr:MULTISPECIES: Dabb family protein [Burkholderia cepacia complex]AOJ21447.1 stress responsive protein [Burkholderia cenocepacia]AQQ32160.1 stress responsive protein [Burkholderia cenocepacia]ELW9445685.1 Dabb family protein [Burkholderia cenocepacia]KOR17518.1 stress responsive protein [Burkholderia cenocepacia]MBJ9731194.1 Dabb family protein [Burkholderia cenocepacia]
MIRHVVMWKVAGATDHERTAARATVKTAFESLRGRIPGMTHLEIGADFSAADYACDLILVADFESREALDGYATHPEHARVRDALTGLRIARHQVDYATE